MTEKSGDDSGEVMLPTRGHADELAELEIDVDVDFDFDIDLVDGAAKDKGVCPKG
jgi:hypothetical protein